MPDFTALMGKSPTTALAWANSNSFDVASNPKTCCEFCTVKAVHAIAACAPLCPMASISACKPAPPDGSSPEKHNTVGRTPKSLNHKICVSIGKIEPSLDSYIL